MQKASKGNRGLARHQLNPTRQGDHLQLLTGFRPNCSRTRFGMTTWYLEDTDTRSIKELQPKNVIDQQDAPPHWSVATAPIWQTLRSG